MSLEPGSHLGAYEILDLLGAGGMGEVYRARDTRLDRTVAIKILQGHLALNPEVRLRFEREARIISSLNHPHIGMLFDVGHLDGMDYLVMEYLEGESLADRLTRGPLPLPDLLKTGIQIADALDRAHRQSLIHRDLKPGNIMMTRSGAKLLDFGLARATGLEPGATSLSSPTMSRPITVEGTIVGTYQYMAPEILEGKEADARSDLFSFGAVLYEMATGHRAFEGKSQASLIASIMKETPRSVSSFDAMVPPALDRTVQRCLEKDPDDRYQTARDVLLDLKWISEAGSRAGVAAPVAARRKTRERLAWGLAAVATAVALATSSALVIRSRQKPEPLRFFIERPEGLRTVGTPKISPDGRYLAFNGIDSTGVSRLWLRPLSSLSAQVLPGTENAARPFWSPDSRYLAFMSDRKLRKIAITGGPPQVLTEIGSNGDGAWGTGGMILFDGSPNDSILGVSTSGGDPVPMTRIDREHGETGNAWPQFLPDGRHFLYLALASKPDQTALYVADTKSSKKILLSRGNISRIEYAEPGYILFVRDGALVAQPFDPRRFKKTGDPFPVVEDVAAGGGVASNADFSASRNGVLVFRGGVGSRSRLTWVDRAGHTLNTVGELGSYGSHVLSPDENRVAVEINAANSAIWIVDTKRGVTSRFTLGGGEAVWPVWSPDGGSIAYTSDKAGGKFGIYVRTARGAPSESLITPPDVDLGPGDWSRDGKYIVALCSMPSGWDLWVVPMNPPGKPAPVVASPASEMEPRISPDSRWLAYTSNESGRREVYVQAFPGPGGKWQVSSQGGRDPEWRADGKELFFIAPNGAMMSVDVTPGPSLDLGTPKPLFLGVVANDSQVGHSYSVSSDGKRFLIRAPDAAGGVPATSVFVNWTAGVSRR